MEENKIDIILPCLLPNETWYMQYNKVKGNEHPGRIRDLGILKYTLRSYAKNLPWLNNVFLVLFDETQIPEWLNVNNPRLKIILHKDFIPEEYLPCFNSAIMQMYFHKIPNLSNTFISSADDYIFVKTIPSTLYFKNGKSVHHPTQKIVQNYNMLTKAQFGKIEKNNYMFLNNYINDGNLYYFWTFHLPMPMKKQFIEFMWGKFEDKFKLLLANSPIRSDHNINNWLFYNFEEFFGETYNEKIYDKYKSSLFGLTDRTTIKNLEFALNTNYILAINDGDEVNYNFDKIKNIVNISLEKVFPDKCEFEK